MDEEDIQEDLQEALWDDVENWVRDNIDKYMKIIKKIPKSRLDPGENVFEGVVDDLIDDTCLNFDMIKNRDWIIDHVLTVVDEWVKEYRIRHDPDY